MSSTLDIERLAKELGAERCEKVSAHGGYFGALQLAAEVASSFHVSEGKQSNENELLKEICKIAREELQDQEHKLELTKTVCECLEAFDRLEQEIGQKTEAVAAKTSEAPSATQENEHRKRLELSQAKLAKLLNVSTNNVLMLHRGYFGVLQLLANIASSPRESEGTRSEYRSEFIKVAFEYLRAALKNELEDEGKQLGE